METKDLKELLSFLSSIEEKQDEILQGLKEIRKFNKTVINKNLQIIGERLG
jgi:hypothetical protein